MSTSPGRALHNKTGGRALHSSSSGRLLYIADTLIIWSGASWLWGIFYPIGWGENAVWQQRTIDATYYGARNRGNPLTPYDPTTDPAPSNGPYTELWDADVNGGGMPWSWDGQTIIVINLGTYTPHRKVVWYFNEAESEWRVDFLYHAAGVGTPYAVHRFAIDGVSGTPPGFHDRYEQVIGDGSIKDVYVRHLL